MNYYNEIKEELKIEDLIKNPIMIKIKGDRVYKKQFFLYTIQESKETKEYFRFDFQRVSGWCKLIVILIEGSGGA